MTQELTKERKTKLIIMGIILFIIPFAATYTDPIDFNLGKPEILILFAAALFGGLSAIYITVIKKRT